MSSEHVIRATEKVTELQQSVHEKHKEFQSVALKCEAIVKQAAMEQKELLEHATSELRRKVQEELQETKQAATESAVNAEESLRVAKNTASSAREIMELMERQLKVRKEEAEKTLSYVKELKQWSEHSSGPIREAEKQAKRAEQNTGAALQKVNSACDKMEMALQRLEELEKKIGSI
jgi:methyl-accepting chemotaxis protein